MPALNPDATHLRTHDLTWVVDGPWVLLPECWDPAPSSPLHGQATIAPLNSGRLTSFLYQMGPPPPQVPQPLVPSASRLLPTCHPVDPEGSPEVTASCLKPPMAPQSSEWQTQSSQWPGPWWFLHPDSYLLLSPWSPSQGHPQPSESASLPHLCSRAKSSAWGLRLSHPLLPRPGGQLLGGSAHRPLPIPETCFPAQLHSS